MIIAILSPTLLVNPLFQLNHTWSSFFYIIPISVLSFCYNIPKFYEHQVVVVSIPSNSTSPDNATNTSYQYEDVVPTSLRTNKSYIKIYCIYLNLVVHGLIPLFLLLILNISIYKQVLHSLHIYLSNTKHSLADHMTKMDHLGGFVWFSSSFINPKLFYIILEDKIV